MRITLDPVNPYQRQIRPKRQFKRLVLALGLLLALATLTSNQASNNTWLEANQPGRYRVVEVADGDTIVVELSGRRETVRLIGVDTPETKDPRKPVQCFGQAASNFTRSLLDRRTVRLEADPADSDRDKYGRLLRYVYLQDGRLLNAELIRQGYGFAYTVFPYARLEEFRGLEREAREAERGLWGECFVDESSTVKQTD